MPTVKCAIIIPDAMGALDKRIFSGVAIIAALLFVVSAVLLLTDGSDVSADSNDTALYILTVSGILAVVYSIVLMKDRSSFVRTMSGLITAVAGILFLIAAFVGESAGIVLAIAAFVAAVAIIADMLAHWVSRVYGAMYVSAVFAAVELAMGVLHFLNGAQTGYYVATVIVFGLWLLLSAYVTGFIKVEAPKTREVTEDKKSVKSDRPMAKNTKGTKKAKKPSKPTESVAEPSCEDVKSEPAEESKPASKPVRTVELPKKNLEAAKAAKPVEEESKEEPKPKEPQKPPAKSMNDFMSKLMSSENAAKAVKTEEKPRTEEIPAEEPKVKSEVDAPAEPESVAVVAEPVDEETIEEAPVEVPETVEDVPEAEPVAEVVTNVVPEESAEESMEEVEESVAAEGSEEPEPVENEAIADVPTEESAEPVDEEAIEEAPAEVPEASELVPEEPVTEVHAEEPEDAPAEIDWSAVVEDASAVPDEIEEAPVQDEMPVEAVAETIKPEPVVETPTPADTPAEDEVSIEDDIYTDYSPEAKVRRAAWNKGLRCRRGYGEHNIPVAFVKGKVAVYVDEAEADTSMDAVLEAEGWTVLRYDASQITDGKAQGDEIAAAVRANSRTTKTSKKAKK